MLVPYPDKETKFLVVPRTIFAKEERVVYIEGVISDTEWEEGTCFSGPFCDDLIQLDREGKEPIKIVVDSIGGDLVCGLKIINTIANLRSEVWMIVRDCRSLATTIVSCGKKGRRYIMEDAVVHLHGSSIGVNGKEADARETMKHMDKQGDKLLNILLKNTNLIEIRDVKAIIRARLEEEENTSEEVISQIKREAIREWLNKERFLNAEEAIKYGIVDEVITPEIQQMLFGVK